MKEFIELNTKVKTTDKAISFTTNINDVQYKKEEWKILLEENIIWINNLKRNILNPKEIKEFIFEILPIPMTHWSAKNQAQAYYIERSTGKIKPFFKIIVGNPMMINKKEPAYRLSEFTLKKLSEKYNIPYSYQEDIAIKKNSKLGLILIILIQVLVLTYVVWRFKN